MANHALPTTTSFYTDVISNIKTRIDDSLMMLDPAVTTVTNPPTNSIRWNSANSKFEKWSGTAWAVLSSSYAINASTASALATTREIKITGDLSWSVNFNGSVNVTGTGILSNTGVTAGTYKIVTVDAKGRVTAGSNTAEALSGLTDTSISSPASGQVLRYNGSVWINSNYEYTTTVEW